jgi:hypothetical protein
MSDKLWTDLDVDTADRLLEADPADPLSLSKAVGVAVTGITGEWEPEE